MKERPIIFSEPMIKAILDGMKTQTRRVIKPQPDFAEQPWWLFDFGHSGEGWYCFEAEYPDEGGVFYKCPYGIVGDHLWVRETYKYWDWTEDGMPWVKYKADDAVWFFDSSVPIEYADRLENIWADLSVAENIARDHKWRPSIFMPRWASRIILEIKDVRVERVQKISTEDIRCEGLDQFPYIYRDEEGLKDFAEEEYRDAFAYKIWNSINGKKYPWDSNPWVWALEFKQIK